MRKGACRIFIVDDHPIICSGLKQLLENEDDLEVCGCAENANRAMESIEKEMPDMAIVDINLKGGISGIELTKGIKNRCPHIPVLVLSMHDETLYAERSIRAGARGYLMKQEMTDVIVQAIRQIMSGQIFLTKIIATRLLDGLIAGRTDKIETPVDTLTNRELEVFQLIGEGHRTSDIAHLLNLSVKTIDTYRLRLKSKFNLKTSSELVKFAIEWGRNNY